MKLQTSSTPHLKQFLLSQIFVLCAVYAPSAFAFSAGAGTLSTVIVWMQGIGVLVCTIAVMWAAFKIMFQGARINDVAPAFIGGVLFGSAAIIAGMFMTT